MYGFQTPYKVDTNSRDVALSVRVVGKSQQQARLSHARITDKEKLEEVIVSERWPWSARLQCTQRTIGKRELDDFSNMVAVCSWGGKISSARLKGQRSMRRVFGFFDFTLTTLDSW